MMRRGLGGPLALCALFDHVGCTVFWCRVPPSPPPGIIDAQLLSWLRPRSALINGGRGRHVVEGDLLAALDNGQVRVGVGGVQV
jgi:glyoxylate/hydroxypyruvate reductase A